MHQHIDNNHFGRAARHRLRLALEGAGLRVEFADAATRATRFGITVSIPDAALAELGDPAALAAELKAGLDLIARHVEYVGPEA